LPGRWYSQEVAQSRASRLGAEESRLIRYTPRGFKRELSSGLTSHTNLTRTASLATAWHIQFHLTATLKQCSCSHAAPLNLPVRPRPLPFIRLIVYPSQCRQTLGAKYRCSATSSTRPDVARPRGLGCLQQRRRACSLVARATYAVGENASAEECCCAG